MCLGCSAVAVGCNVDDGRGDSLVDGDGAVGIESASAVGGAADVERAALDGDVLLGADGSAIVEIGARCVDGTRLVDGELAALHQEAALSLDAFRTGTRRRDVERTARELHLARVLVLDNDVAVVVGVITQLDAVVADAADGYLTTLHLEILIDVETVAHSLRDVECAEGLLHLDILLAPEGMTCVSFDGEHTGTFQLGMAFHHETGLPRATLAVAECVGRSVGQFEADALAVADVDGRTVRIVERQSVEHERSLQLTVHPQRAVVRLSAQDVADFVAGIVGSLYECHMGSLDRGIDVGRDVASYGDVGRRAVVVDADGVGCHISLVDGDARDVAEHVFTLADGQRHTVAERHLPCIGSGDGIGDVALMDVHCLGLHIQRCYKEGCQDEGTKVQGCEGARYDILEDVHFTVIFTVFSLFFTR